jgi:hypothetical protein
MTFLRVGPRDVADARGRRDGQAEEAYFRLVQQGLALFLVPREHTDPQQSWPEITVTGGFRMVAQRRRPASLADARARPSNYPWATGPKRPPSPSCPA